MGSQRLAHLLTLSIRLNSGFAIARGAGDGIAGGPGIVGDEILGSVMVHLVVVFWIELLVLLVADLGAVLMVVFGSTAVEVEWASIDDHFLHEVLQSSAMYDNPHHQEGN